MMWDYPRYDDLSATGADGVGELYEQFTDAGRGETYEWQDTYDSGAELRQLYEQFLENPVITEPLSELLEIRLKDLEG